MAQQKALGTLNGAGTDATPARGSRLPPGLGSVPVSWRAGCLGSLPCTAGTFPWPPPHPGQLFHTTPVTLGWSHLLVAPRPQAGCHVGGYQSGATHRGPSRPFRKKEPTPHFPAPCSSCPRGVPGCSHHLDGLRAGSQAFSKVSVANTWMSSSEQAVPGLSLSLSVVSKARPKEHCLRSPAGGSTLQTSRP